MDNLVDYTQYRLRLRPVPSSKPENANPIIVTEVPVTEIEMTFVEALKAGFTRLIDVDDWVEAWHTQPTLTAKSLRDYLGFSQELYASWMRNGNDALMALMEISK